MVILEEWRKIESLDGKYEVSNLGKIRNSKTLNIKTQVFDGHYYKFGYDYTINGNRKRGWYRVHKAVAEAFIDNKENKTTINHKDGNTANNSVENLEWATPKEQMKHATYVLKRNCGENKSGSLFTNEQVKQMRKLHEIDGMTSRQIADLFETKTSYVTRILNYQRYIYI